MVQVGYNAQHRIPWHWPVPAYLVTKGIGTGVYLLLALLFGLGVVPFDPFLAVIGGGISTVFMVATTVLLVIDLEKPQRFLYILMRPQWRSWLARGAIFLIGFSTIVGLFTTVELAALLSLIDKGLAEGIRPFLLWSGVPFAVGAAIYTAFLFGQAEGRDLWQSPLLPPHLLVQAVMVGAAALLVAGIFVDLGALASPIRWTLVVALVVDLFVLLGEVGMPHASEVAARAAHSITHGRYKTQFWAGAIALGHVLPLLLALVGGAWLLAVAGALTSLGLWFYEHAFVMAPQEIPNS
jgi:formate-dependent nitrite reductase membrane component NrfD